MKKRLYSTKEMALIALFVALISVSAWISIPMAIPFTLQTFAIFTAVGLLGLKNGLTAFIVYCILGVVGLPVFSGFRGGPGVLLGPTGGYIVGFILSVIAIGFLIKKLGKSIPVLVCSMIIGIILCYAFGTAWFIIMYTNTTGAIAIGTALTWCVTPYIIPDAAKIALAIFMVKAIDKSKVLQNMFP